ncbi:MAG: Flp pilus assembly complex ATPase component TadA, partial [Armatimonadetes bacterium]|nr:Flp pilus assembly complex ATPase component TadA [Armatimonadota bacterium]
MQRNDPVAEPTGGPNPDEQSRHPDDWGEGFTSAIEDFNRRESPCSGGSPLRIPIRSLSDEAVADWVDLLAREVVNRHGSLEAALATLAETSPQPRFHRKVAVEVMVRMRKGRSFARAVASVPYMPRLVAESVAIAESVEAVPQILSVLRHHANSGYRLRYSNWRKPTHEELSFWCRLTAALLDHGVEPTEALRHAARPASRRLRRFSHLLAEGIAKSVPFSEALQSTRLGTLLLKFSSGGEEQVALTASVLRTWAETLDRIEEVALKPEPQGEIVGPREPTEEAPVIKIVNSLLQSALTEHVSTMAIEPDEKRLKIRHRVDGVWREVAALPSYVSNPVRNRLHVMAGVSMIRGEDPPVGRIHLRFKNQDWHCKTTFHPSIYGEIVQMKLRCVIGPMDAPSGITEDQQVLCQEWVNRPSGLVLLIGPPDSGKTATLHRLLGTTNLIERRAVFLTHWSEARYPGISYRHWGDLRSPTLARTLQQVMSDSLDLLTVDDLNDPEAVSVAAELALSHCLVLAAMESRHGGERLLSQLLSRGIPAWLLADSLVGLLQV